EAELAILVVPPAIQIAGIADRTHVARGRGLHEGGDRPAEVDGPDAAGKLVVADVLIRRRETDRAITVTTPALDAVVLQLGASTEPSDHHVLGDAAEVDVPYAAWQLVVANVCGVAIAEFAAEAVPPAADRAVHG